MTPIKDLCKTWVEKYTEDDVKEIFKAELKKKGKCDKYALADRADGYNRALDLCASQELDPVKVVKCAAGYLDVEKIAVILGTPKGTKFEWLTTLTEEERNWYRKDATTLIEHLSDCLKLDVK